MGLVLGGCLHSVMERNCTFECMGEKVHHLEVPGIRSVEKRRYRGQPCLNAAETSLCQNLMIYLNELCIGMIVLEIT